MKEAATGESRLMTPMEFVSGLADVMGVARTELATVDRSLAKQGFRQLSRGRFHPDITLEEGLRLVCCWAGAENLTEAANEVGRLEDFFPEVISREEYEMTGRSREELFSVCGRQEHELQGINFWRVLSGVARQLATEAFPSDRLWVSVEKGGPPEIKYRFELVDKRLTFHEMPKNFKFNFEADRPRAPQVNVRVKTSVRGSVIKWIYEVTEGV